MRLCRKILIVGLFTLLTSVFVFMNSPFEVSAQLISRNDCVGFANVNPQLWPPTVQQRIATHEKPRLTIFTDQDLFTAVIHLQNYCCDAGQMSADHCAQVPRTPSKRYPESPYIVDQLMFIGMKKLDGETEDCKRLGIDCVTRTYEVDPVEWRETINEIAEDTKGYPPSYIFESFRRTWLGPNTDLTDMINLATPTLAKSYWAMCNDLGTLRFVTGLQGGSIDANLTGGQSIEQLCLQRVKDRYIQEENYIKGLQLEKGRQYFTDNLKAYIYDYYIDTRLAGLMSKYATLDSCFQTILRYVQKTSCCNL